MARGRTARAAAGCTAWALLLALGACSGGGAPGQGQPTKAEAGAKSDAEAEGKSEAGTEPVDDQGLRTGKLDEATLTAKVDGGLCAAIEPATVQQHLGLATLPTAVVETIAGPPNRDQCTYAWDDGGTPRSVALGWATGLTRRPGKIARGLMLTREDIAKRLAQPVEVDGQPMASWREMWLTVYPNDAQMFFVIMEDSGLSPAAARDGAAKIATSFVQ